MKKLKTTMWGIISSSSQVNLSICKLLCVFVCVCVDGLY